MNFTYENSINSATKLFDLEKTGPVTINGFTIMNVNAVSDQNWIGIDSK
jgi:hypothetical protein